MANPVETYEKQIQEKGYASLTQGQRDIYGALQKAIKISETPSAPITNQSTTVASNSNIKEKVIPDTKKRLEDLKAKPMTYNQNGQLVYSDGSLVSQSDVKLLGQYVGGNETGQVGENIIDTRKESPNYGKNVFVPMGSTLEEVLPIAKDKTTTGTEPIKSTEEYAQEFYNTQKQIAAQLKADTDPNTRRMIDSITQKYEQLIAKQKEINSSVEAGRMTGLLGGGAMRGSTGDITVGYYKSFGLEKVAELEDEEKSLINKTQIEADKGNWEEAGKILDKAEKKREEKQKEAQKLQDKIDEENKKLKEKKDKIDNETTVGKLYDSGMTEPVDIQNFMKDKGIIVSLDDIDKALKIINPDENLTGVSADLKTFKQFFPDVDITKEEGRQKYLDWQREVDAANYKATETEKTRALKTSAFSKARPFLEQSKGEDGYVDPGVYMRLRTDYSEVIGDPSDFDDAFASYLSPQERARLGLGKAVGLKAIETNIETNIDEESPY